MVKREYVDKRYGEVCHAGGVGALGSAAQAGIGHTKHVSIDNKVLIGFVGHVRFFVPRTSHEINEMAPLRKRRALYRAARWLAKIEPHVSSSHYPACVLYDKLQQSITFRRTAVFRG